MDRAFAVLQTSYNRLAANNDQLGAVAAAYDNDKVPLDLYLDAQRRVADSEIDYHLSRSRYSMSLKNVHFVKGTLLEYDGVFLAEGPWPGKAYEDAAEREASRSRPRPLNYASSRAPIVSAGQFDQQAGTAAGSCDSTTVTQPQQMETVPVPSDVVPLKTPAEGAAPTTGSGARSGAVPKMLQPEGVQAAGTDTSNASKYPVIGAGHTDYQGETPPEVVLRTGSLPDPNRDVPASPAEPQRLPPTAGR
jgi:hypothetical protein